MTSEVRAGLDPVVQSQDPADDPVQLLRDPHGARASSIAAAGVDPALERDPEGRFEGAHRPGHVHGPRPDRLGDHLKTARPREDPDPLDVLRVGPIDLRELLPGQIRAGSHG